MNDNHGHAGWVAMVKDRFRQIIAIRNDGRLVVWNGNKFLPDKHGHTGPVAMNKERNGETDGLGIGMWLMFQPPDNRS